MAIKNIRIGAHSGTFKDKTVTAYGYLYYDDTNYSRFGFVVYERYTYYNMSGTIRDYRPSGTPTVSLYIDNSLIATVSAPQKVMRRLSTSSSSTQSYYCYYSNGAITENGDYDINLPANPPAFYNSSFSLSKSIKMTMTRDGQTINITGTFSAADFMQGTISSDAARITVGTAFPFRVTNIHGGSFSGFSWEVDVQTSSSGGSVYKHLNVTPGANSWTPTFAEVMTLFRQQTSSYYTSVYIYCKTYYTSGGVKTQIGTASYIYKSMYMPSVNLTIPSAINTGGTVSVTLGGDSIITSSTCYYVLSAHITNTDIIVGQWSTSGSGKTFNALTSIFAPALPNSTNGTIQFTLKAYYGASADSSKYINYQSVNVTVNLRQSDLIASPQLQAVDMAGWYQQIGKFVVNQSYLNCNVIPNLAYGATLSNVRVDINGTFYTSQAFQTGVIDPSQVVNNQLAVTVTVVDSRSITSTRNITLDVIEYFLPQITSLAVHRGTVSGGVWTADDNGDKVKIEWGINVAPIANTSTSPTTYENTAAVTINPPSGVPYVPTLPAYPAAFTATGDYIDDADTEHSYVITAVVTDSFVSVTRQISLSTAGVALDIRAGGKGVGLGKVAETDNMIEVNPQWTFKATNVMIGNQSLADYIRSVVSSL